MAKKKSKRSGKSGHTPLAEHRKRGTVFTTPLADYPIEANDWQRDYLPEYLWMGALAQHLPVTKMYNPVYEVMDAAEHLWSESYPPIGVVSDFGFIRDKEGFLSMNKDLIREAIIKPFGRVLSMYPESPAAWLLTPEFREELGHLESDKILSETRAIVLSLIDGQGMVSTACKMVSLARVIKAGKLIFQQGSTIAEKMPKYPDKLTADERSQVEGSVRASMTSVLGQVPRFKNREWAKYFWRHNYDLATCQPSMMQLSASKAVGDDLFTQLERSVSENCKMARKYLEQLTMQYRVDLYDPLRYEIVSGLFSRAIRLFLLVNENPRLWARDVSGIMLRCLVETAISFCYLGEKGTDDEFRRFKEYGKGQKKLLMLHLQDSYPGEATLEGHTVENIRDELGGGFAAEMIQIESGSWAKKDTRRLALEVGLENYYRLVFSPTSADVHGTWASLSDSNLCICAEPLHRFHQMPSYSEPPLFVNTLVAVQELLSDIYKRAVEKLGFPKGMQFVSLRQYLHETDVKSLIQLN